MRRYEFPLSGNIFCKKKKYAENDSLENLQFCYIFRAYNRVEMAHILF